MRVLVIGGDGRAHAIAWKLKNSPLLTKLYCAPGNAGTAAIGENIDLQVSNTGALALWALENKIDLTVVSPEGPLMDGVVDVFSEHGLRIFGPMKAAAQLEGSKVFSKEVMLKAGVRTPLSQSFNDYSAAMDYLKKHGAPVVIKADGLCAGKGVTVAMTLEEASDALARCLEGGAFGAAGATVLVEDFIEGKEASLMALVDGSTVLPFVLSQDHKRLLDGDRGPNTGGMGAISPTPVFEDKHVEGLVSEIMVPVLQELARRDIRYVGFLYAGIIVDREGNAHVLEFNCRLGDPEAQVLLPRLKSDLLAVLDAALGSRLASVELQWTVESCATVVVASEGYPGGVNDGKIIEGLEIQEPNTFVFHAGTKYSEESGLVVSKGGRILTVTGLGKDLDQALERAYRRLEKINFEGMQFRMDIGRAGQGQ